MPCSNVAIGCAICSVRRDRQSRNGTRNRPRQTCCAPFAGVSCSGRNATNPRRTSAGRKSSLGTPPPHSRPFARRAAGADEMRPADSPCPTTVCTERGYAGLEPVVQFGIQARVHHGSGGHPVAAPDVVAFLGRICGEEQQTIGVRLGTRVDGHQFGEGRGGDHLPNNGSVTISIPASSIAFRASTVAAVASRSNTSTSEPALASSSIVIARRVMISLYFSWSPITTIAWTRCSASDRLPEISLMSNLLRFIIVITPFVRISPSSGEGKCLELDRGSLFSDSQLRRSILVCCVCCDLWTTSASVKGGSCHDCVG
jgi:hypothetical protein